MLIVAAWIAVSPAPSLPPPHTRAAVARAEDPGVPPRLSQAYLAAQSALRLGDDDAALLAWRDARAQVAALPSSIRFARETRDGVVRYELRLAEIARARFERIRAGAAMSEPTGDEALRSKVAEKRRLFALLAGEPGAFGAQGFAGALVFVPAVNPSLRGVHCQRAELIARFQRWLAELPCAAELSDAECEASKARGDGDTAAWRAEVVRAQQACLVAS